MKGKFNNNCSGGSPAETTIALAVIVTIAIAASPTIEWVKSYKEKYIKTEIQALDEAANKAKILSKKGDGTKGVNAQKAIQWYKDNTIISKDKKVEISELYFYNGDWFKKSLPENKKLKPDGDELFKIFFPKEESEKNLKNMMAHFGATSKQEMLNKIQENYCRPITPEELLYRDYGCSDLQSLQEKWGYKSMDELAQQGFKQKNSDDLQKYIQNISAYPINKTAEEQLKSWYGKTNVEEIANKNFEVTKLNNKTKELIQELAARWEEYPQKTVIKIYQALTLKYPTKEVLIPLNAGIVNFIEENKQLQTNPDIQDTLFDMLGLGASLNCLGEIDLSQIDLNNRSLEGLKLSESNLTGYQLNQAESLAFSDLSKMNLEGIKFANKNLKNINLTDVKGIDAEDLFNALDLQNSNLSGIDFQHISLTKKDLTGVIIKGASDLVGANFNGVTSVAGATLENLDLSNWKVLPEQKQSVASFKNCALNEDLLLKGQLARGASLEGVDLTWWKPKVKTLDYLLNLNGAKIKIENFNNVIQFPWTDFGKADMKNFLWENKRMGGCNLSNTTGITGENLSKLSTASFAGKGINLAGLDLTGWVPTYSIENSDLSNTKGIIIENLIQATSLQGINLTGAGITKEALQAVLINAGKNPQEEPYNVETIKF